MEVKFEMVVMQPTMFAPGANWYFVEDLFNPETRDAATEAFQRNVDGRKIFGNLKLLRLLNAI